jgi:hypothetical protein
MGKAGQRKKKTEFLLLAQRIRPGLPVGGPSEPCFANKRRV